MEQKKYWQSFGELNNSEAHQKNAKDEFKEELPFDNFDAQGLSDAKTPRRDFLKYLGFSTAAAAIAASCEIPVKKAIPFVNRPADVIPGVANYYLGQPFSDALTLHVTNSVSANSVDDDLCGTARQRTARQVRSRRRCG